MNFIELNSTYRLYAFPDYRTMKEGQTNIKRVVLAKEFNQVREIEAKRYVRKIGKDNHYQNYLRTDTGQAQSTGLESLVSALQALYKLNGYSSKFIVIEGLY